MLKLQEQEDRLLSESEKRALSVRISFDLMANEN